MNKQKDVKVSITLGRQLLGTILTAYIPTVLLLIISHNANFFKPFFFEAAISVNVTTMLVLTTLFISISGSLPTTSYIKMIDIWMIFSLMIPFFEVLVITYIDNLRQEQENEREINHHGEKRKVEKNDAVAEKEENKPGLKTIFVGGNDKVVPYDKDLISRQEVTQDDALKKFYSLAIITNEMKLKLALSIAHFWIPLIVLVFIIVYWCVGLKHAEFF